MESYILGEMLSKLGIYSSASMQAHQRKILLCIELGQTQDLKLYRNYYEGIIGLSWFLTH